MCGFAGLYLLAPTLAPAEATARVAAMAAAIAHRGPDAQNVLSESFAVVGFRRLAIVDLVTGDQPVRSRCGRIQVFFNGEIYNHLELREKLRVEHGIEVTKGSDAAVLPHLYECYGPDFVELCNGMFAICVLDGRDRSCRIYRDRLGIKPMYFAVTEQAVVFGSELKTLFASGLVEPAIDEAQLVPFLELFYVPGQATLCRGVQKLLPGERLVLRQGQPPQRERWWRLAQRVAPKPGDQLDQLDALLQNATELQLMADVPIGISLSGGLDSSLIAYYAHRGDAKVRAFTIAFPDTDPGELACARAVSKQLGIDQVELSAPAADFLGELDATTWFNDEPVADPAFFPALCVARAAAQHVKVLLAGSGADELFAGYGHYRLTARATAYRLLATGFGDGIASKATGMRHPAPARAAIRAFAKDRLPWHALAMTHLNDADRQALRPLVRQDHLAELAECFRTAAGLDPRNRQLCVDTETYLPHQLLSLLDRTTMGASIEGRVPFLDHRLVEFALGIHGDHKYGNKHQNKLLLRKLAQRHLPAEVAVRKKHGFPNAVQRWLGPERLGAVRDRLCGKDSFVGRTFPAAWLQSLLGSPQQLQHNALTVHSLLVLDSWQRVFVQQARAGRRQPVLART
ncbi:MAG: asparagine synthase (glutamine-hydrolyzing) [Planctomycetes bacterium]|jgi:asparagine synthase (glutamine-hydrolysing)|nr:asparagine synthase (glutamine-hydrolyzing) [Planctomycetota bacterium]